MTVLRIQKKENNFLMLDKECINNSKLSWAAKGLHAYLMGMATGWKVQVQHLQKQAINGRDAVRKYLAELEGAGYIIKEWIRDSVTGKFTHLEYVVYETSQNEGEELSSHKDCRPSTENPSGGNSGGKVPGLVNPATVTPAPANPPLININNKYINNKITAADKILEITSRNAAASSNQFLSAERRGTVELVSKPEDSIIGDKLTDFQLNRISSFVYTKSCFKGGQLCEEIKFCLLDPKQFTGCGNDFAKKFNAIKKIIRQGSWQTPKGMISNEKPLMDRHRTKLEDELRSTYAEVRHFEYLMNSAKEVARKNFEEIINKAKKRIEHLEQDLLKLGPLLQQTC